MVPPFDFFRHCATFFEKFLMPQKSPPFESFLYFATECMLINPKGPPFYNFKNLRFLSLRYSADFRRSRLVDVTSDLYCVLLRKRRRFKKISDLSQHGVSELLYNVIQVSSTI